MPIVYVYTGLLHAGQSQALYLYGHGLYNIGSEYLMNCIGTSGSFENAYITINGTEQFTKDHGQINAERYSLTVKIFNISLDYNATIFQCHADEQSSNNLTIYGRCLLMTSLIVS